MLAFGKNIPVVHAVKAMGEGYELTGGSLRYRHDYQRSFRALSSPVSLLQTFSSSPYSSFIPYGLEIHRIIRRNMNVNTDIAK